MTACQSSHGSEKGQSNHSNERLNSSIASSVMIRCWFKGRGQGLGMKMISLVQRQEKQPAKQDTFSARPGRMLSL